MNTPQPSTGTEGRFVACASVGYGPERLHPEDRPQYEAIHAAGNFVFESLGEEDGYERLRAGDFVFRVPVGKTVPMERGPRFRVGDTVRTMRPRSSRVAPVAQVAPHYKRRVPIYFLRISGGRKHSWFEEEHLELVERRG